MSNGGKLDLKQILTIAGLLIGTNSGGAVLWNTVLAPTENKEQKVTIASQTRAVTDWRELYEAMHADQVECHVDLRACYQECAHVDAPHFDSGE